MSHETLNMHVTIIGAGFSGTMLAVNLINQLPANQHFRIALIEKSGVFARGVAYSTKHPRHLLNVRAMRMGAIASDPEHFLRWLRSNNIPVQPTDFVPRVLYARYLESLFTEAQALAKQKQIDLVCITGEVKAISGVDSKEMRVEIDQETTITTSIVVLATNLPFKSFEVPPDLADIYTDNIWKPRPDSLLTLSDLSHLSPKTHVAIIGSGLTMADAVVSLDALNFSGHVSVISRHGRISTPHLVSNEAWPTFQVADQEVNLSFLIKAFQKSLKAAERQGIDWRSVFDALRPVTTSLWKRLSLADKKRFMRHLLSLWNHCRHRIPTQSFNILKKLQSQKKLHLLADSVQSIQKNPKTGKAIVAGHNVTLEVDCVLNCSGIQFDISKNPDRLFKSLLENKMIQPHPLKMGLDVDDQFKVCGNDYAIYALGQLLWGKQLETVAVPELREQCHVLAKEIVRRLGEQQI